MYEEIHKEEHVTDWKEPSPASLMFHNHSFWLV